MEENTPDATGPASMRYQVDDLIVDVGVQRVTRAGTDIPLSHLSFELLLALARAAPDMVSFDDLIERVWPGLVITPETISQRVKLVRDALGDDPHAPRYIGGVRGRGYRMVAPVRPLTNRRRSFEAETTADVPEPIARESAGPPREITIAQPVPAPQEGLRPTAEAVHTNTAAATVTDKSIAVLPFVDMSEKKDQGYFADGMAEEIVHLLARVPGIRVIGRSSSSQFKGKNQDLRTIGGILGAAYVLEGSVRRSGNRLRVTAQLIGTQDGSHLWSGSYDKDYDEVLEIEDQIAAGLVRALQVAVGVDLPSRPVLKSAVGYDLYQRGRHELDRFNKAGFESAAGYFQQALALDPTAVRAAESLALVHIYITEWGYAPPHEGFERARKLCENVITLDPTSGIAHAQLAFIHAVYDWDWAAAVGKVQRALALDPRDPGILVTAGIIHLSLDRLDEATAFLNAASALDPLGAISHAALGTISYRSGRIAEAEARLRTAIQISPTFLWAHWTLGTVLLAAGKLEAALAQMQQATTEGGGDAGLALVYHAMKRRTESDAALARATLAYADHWAYVVAEVHAYRGEIDQALAWLERAYRQKDAALYRVKGDPLLRDLEPDVRFKAFLRKMNLPA